MKMGSMAVAMAMVMVVMSGMVLHGAEAQGTVSCLTVSGGSAPFGDATTLTQQLRVTSGQCCQSSSGFCTVVLASGNAAATVCGPTNYCPNCADVGNNLNQVLAQCNQQNTVQGVYSPDGTTQQLHYLTSVSNHP